MYITAHRVVAPQADAQGRRAQGINAFVYEHGESYVWGDDGVLPAAVHPDTNPGVLADRMVAVPPPGNRVRSYLDMVAPDEAPMAELVHAVTVLAAGEAPDALPITWMVGRVWCRLGMEDRLVAGWREELRLLFGNIATLFVRRRPGL